MRSSPARRGLKTRRPAAPQNKTRAGLQPQRGALAAGGELVAGGALAALLRRLTNSSLQFPFSYRANHSRGGRFRLVLKRHSGVSKRAGTGAAKRLFAGGGTGRLGRSLSGDLFEPGKTTGFHRAFYSADRSACDSDATFIGRVLIVAWLLAASRDRYGSERAQHCVKCIGRVFKRSAVAAQVDFAGQG
jgi:hypothetical protein